MVTRLGTILGTLLGTDIGSFTDNPTIGTLSGADGFASTAYYASTANDSTVSSQPFWNAFLFYPPTITQVGSVSAGAATTLAGWDLRFGSNNTTANWGMGDGTTYNFSGNAVLDKGKVNLLVCVWDQAALKQRTYVRRAEVGAGVGRTGYAAPVAGTKIGLGRSPRDVASAVGSRTLLGFSQGVGLPALADIQALFDAIKASGSMQGISGMTSFVVDLNADIAANNNLLPASLSNRAPAVDTFTRTGTPSLSQVPRIYAW